MGDLTPIILILILTLFQSSGSLKCAATYVRHVRYARLQIRERIFEQVQQKLKCKRGEQEMAVFSLDNLLQGCQNLVNLKTSVSIAMLHVPK